MTRQAPRKGRERQPRGLDEAGVVDPDDQRRGKGGPLEALLDLPQLPEPWLRRPAIARSASRVNSGSASQQRVEQWSHRDEFRGGLALRAHRILGRLPSALRVRRPERR